MLKANSQYKKEEPLPLTAYEVSLLRDIAAGHRLVTIAERRDRNAAAINSAFARIREKLRASGNHEAVSIAQQLGYFPKAKELTRPNILSPTERKIFAALHAGSTRREIADRRNISIRAINSHIWTAMSKLRATTIETALKIAVENDLLKANRIPHSTVEAIRASRRRPELSGREEEILNYMARGISTRPDLAKRLGVSESTITQHVQKLRRKVGAGHAREIVERAFALKLLKGKPRKSPTSDLSPTALHVLGCLAKHPSVPDAYEASGLARPTVNLELRRLRRHFGVWEVDDLIKAAKRERVLK